MNMYKGYLIPVIFPCVISIDNCIISAPKFGAIRCSNWGYSVHILDYILMSNVLFKVYFDLKLQLMFLLYVSGTLYYYFQQYFYIEIEPNFPIVWGAIRCILTKFGAIRHIFKMTFYWFKCII